MELGNRPPSHVNEAPKVRPEQIQAQCLSGHCHVALEKSDMGGAVGVSRRNDGGAFWLSGGQTAIVSRQVSNRF
jgi:hypothetical protein